MLGGREGVDDSQPSAAAWAGQCEGSRRWVIIICAWVAVVIEMWCFGSEQVLDLGDIGCTVAVSEEAIVANAVLAA